jgi:hypothetical protein
VSATSFAAVAVTIYAGHQAGDYWVQTSGQAVRKSLPGSPGRLACAAHVSTYTATLAAFLFTARVFVPLPLSDPHVLAGLAVSAVSHYIADRRKPLARIARALGREDFYRAGDGLATGAALLDQAWHWAWLFVSALVIAGGAR